MRSRLFDAVTNWGEIEWARGVTNSERPPFFVWRFVNTTNETCQLMVKLIAEFKGGVEWGLHLTGRNWVLEPTAVTQFSASSSFQTDVEMSESFARRYPEIVIVSNADVHQLAKLIAVATPS